MTSDTALAFAETGDLPPFNATRFAKLPSGELQEAARAWMNVESAFAMCLNAAQIQGATNFASELATGLQSAPLAQAFWTYRSGGRIKQALQMAAGPITALIRDRGGIAGAVIDALTLAQEHNHVIYETLLRKIARARPDLKMNPSGHAWLDRKIRAALGDDAAETLNEKSEGGGFAGDMSIAGITKVRNEGELVSACVGSMLKSCDFVLVFGHVPDDGAPEDAQAQFGRDRVEILRDPALQNIDDKAIYDHLFARARERRATHIVMVDADETLGPAYTNPAALRKQARRLARGESLAAPFAQAFGDGLIDYEQFASFNDRSRLLPPYKDLIYCDDGKALHRDLALHNPWLPDGYPLRRRFLHDKNSGLIHFEKANPLNAFIKADRYVATELLQHKTPMPIILARYLPGHLVYNFLHDHPPPMHDLAKTDCAAYARLADWRLDEVQDLAKDIPQELRYLFNFDYWR